MKIEVTFGLSLDGAAGQSGDGFGKLRVGPAGLLGFLELHTGLSRKAFSHIERVSAFLGVLNESYTNIPSFSASFSVDPLATAQRLLGWLDAWQLHGWNGNLPKDAPARLRELATVAHHARGRVPPSEGERLDAVCSALMNGSRVPLSTIWLCEDLDAYPAGWKRLLEHLPHQPVHFRPSAEPSSDLGKLQRALAGGTAESFSNDGSLRVFRARTVLGAARFLASGGGGAGGGPARDGPAGGSKPAGGPAGTTADAMILVGGSGSLWDEACVSQGVPRPAAFGWSTSRPALQVLPLALALHREPLDVEALLAFLTHPICPLGYERRFFAEALAADGGLGGPQWVRARKRALESYTRYGKDPKKLDELLAEWIPDERHGGEALPLELLRSTAKGARRYLSARSSARENSTEAEKTVLADAVGQCSLFERTLGLLGESFDNVPVNVANGLLAAATQAFGARHEGRRELGSNAWVEDPGAIIDPVGKLTWLLPARPESPEPWPWSAGEIAALSTCDMELPTLSDLNARITRDWMRAISLATNCLELILPPEGREAHPLSLLISSIRPGFEKDMEAAALAGTGSPLATVSRIRLPGPKRWWKIPRSLCPEPGWRASYSQMNTLLRRPAQWVLEHKARIRTSAILSVPDRETLAGTFAHALVQRCIETFGARATRLNETGFAAWYDAAFESLLASQGARWLEPGAAQERLRLRESLYTSIGALLSQLRAANAVTLESEKELEGVLFSIPFRGMADIVLKNGFNRHAIIDMKNSHWLDGYRDMLERDTDIQLTIYAELYRQGSGAEAEAVYYLIPKEKLLAREPSIFSLAELLGSARTHAQRLGMIKTSFVWRRHQLDEGRIEVVCEATEELGAPAEAPEGGLPLEEAFDLYDPFLGIYGWSDLQ
jgi:PD-(D/E)XK nuclease superfamily